MVNSHDEQPDLDRVADYLASHGLSAKPLAEEEKELPQGKKNPDFRVRKDGVVVAYCEVKSPQDDPVWKARSDPTFPRLIHFLEKAAKQFDAFNPSRTELNILAYVSHKPTTLYKDLHEMLTGRFPGTEVLTMRPPIEAKSIDIYLWFDDVRPEPELLVNDLDPDRVRRVCALFDAASSRPS
jgi:hypothetical protein